MLAAEDGSAIYILGGTNGSTFAASLIAPVDGTGRLCTFLDAGAPWRTYDHASAIANSAILVSAGASSDGGTRTENDVGLVRDNGISWSAGTAFSAPSIRGHSIAVVGDYLYVAAGRQNATNCASAPITGNTLGAWMPKNCGGSSHNARPNAAMAQRGPALYVSGGGTMTNGTVHLVGNGDFSSSAFFTMPGNLQRTHHTSHVHRDELLIIGGFTGTAATADIFSAPILPDGGIGTWTKLGELPEPRHAHGSAIIGSRLYVVGGKSSSGSESSTIFYGHIIDGGIVWR